MEYFLVLIVCVLCGFLVLSSIANTAKNRDKIAEHAQELLAIRYRTIPKPVLGLVDLKKWNQAKRQFIFGHFRLSGRRQDFPEVNRWMREIDQIIDTYQQNHVHDTIDEVVASSQGGGIVYLLQNPAMPGLVKIGLTTRSMGERLRELNSATGVPVEFVHLYDVSVGDCAAAEQFVHQTLAQFRERREREFFRVSAKQAIDTLLLAERRYPPRS